MGSTCEGLGTHRRCSAVLVSKIQNPKSRITQLYLCVFLAVSFSVSPFTNAQDFEVKEEPDPFGFIGEIKGDPKVEEKKNEEADAEKEEDKEKENKSKLSRPLGAQIARQIKKLAEEERKKRMDFMGVVIEDVTRLCQLDEAQQKQINLAAKGSTERSMKKWHEQAERYFASRLSGADDDTAKEILENIGNVNFGGRDAEKESETQALWKDAVTNILTDDQVKRYEEVVEQRNQERIEAFTKMSVSSLDNHLRLTPEQRKKLEVIVKASATEYLEDVQRYWGDYFERGMLMSLANSADDEELKKILTEKQFTRHKTATSNFDHFWDQKRRMKKAREKAAEKRKEKEQEKEKEAEKEKQKKPTVAAKTE